MTVIERDPTYEALTEARNAIHRLCLERGSTDGYKAVFEQINVARRNHRGAVRALELIASRYDWDASACPKIAHAALAEMGLRPTTTGGQ